jgi:hypothetical protein
VFIFVKVKDTSRVYKIKAQISDLISDIKVLIQKASNISKKMQRLIYVNRFELEDALPLSFYDIFKSKNYCTLTLIVSDPISDRLSIKAGSIMYDEGISMLCIY